MKPNSLLIFVVLLAHGTLTSGAVEDATKGKPKEGACPFRIPVLCGVLGPPRCKSDWQCPNKQKCCPDFCGNKCLDPVDTSEPVEVKPGLCPRSLYVCRRPILQDRCLNDSHCLGDLKCCYVGCRKSCVPPVSDFVPTVQYR